MSWVAAAVIGGTALAGAYVNAKAGQASADAANNASNLQNQQFNMTLQDMLPWLQAGQGALGQLTSGIQPGGNLVRPFTLADYTADPGYQFRLQQGEQQLQNQAAAQGDFYSPNFINSAQRYAQDLASQEYGNAYNRYVTNQTNTFNRLADVAGLGQTAANQIGSFGQTAANNIGNANMTGAQARGQGAVGATNALMGGVGNYMYYNTLQNYLNSNPLYNNSANIGNYNIPSVPDLSAGTVYG